MPPNKAPWPLELAPLERCAAGCAFKLQAHNASVAAAAAPAASSSAVVDETPPSPPTLLPEPALRLPRPPALRLGIYLVPPLATPLWHSLESFCDQLTAALSTDRFLVRKQRIRPIEVSRTGAFALLDVRPEDIMVHTPGPGVKEVVERLVVHALELAVVVTPPMDELRDAIGDEIESLPAEVIAESYGTSHRADPRLGIWRIEVEPSMVDPGTRGARLWPADDLQASLAMLRAPQQAASAEGGGAANAALEDALVDLLLHNAQEERERLRTEERTDETDDEPIFKAVVVLATLALVASALAPLLWPLVLQVCKVAHAMRERAIEMCRCPSWLRAARFERVGQGDDGAEAMEAAEELPRRGGGKTDAAALAAWLSRQKRRALGPSHSRFSITR